MATIVYEREICLSTRRRKYQDKSQSYNWSVYSWSHSFLVQQFRLTLFPSYLSLFIKGRVFYCRSYFVNQFFGGNYFDLLSWNLNHF